jgi:hypothetical protein
LSAKGGNKKEKSLKGGTHGHSFVGKQGPCYLGAVEQDFFPAKKVIFRLAATSSRLAIHIISARFLQFRAREGIRYKGKHKANFCMAKSPEMGYPDGKRPLATESIRRLIR